jgi:glycosyltransferase involved in cell wall biosynthesis
MPASPTIPVTVVIAARNEAHQIVACIDTVRWAAEIIVAEHGSLDHTAPIAHEAGAIVNTDAAPTIGAQRNAAIARASHDWILVVDADERATPALRDAVAATITNAAHDAYRIPRRNFFLGREIRHGGWNHDRPVRLFRSHLRYNDSKVHEHVIAPDPVGTLHEPLLHTPYESLDHYFDKFTRYSRWWAEQQYHCGRRTNAAAVLYKPPARFFKTYLLQLGVLDGAPGLILACLASASVLAKYARLWGLQQEPPCAS